MTKSSPASLSAVGPFRAVDKAPTQPYLCETGAVAMALVGPRFSTLNLDSLIPTHLADVPGSAWGSREASQ